MSHILAAGERETGTGSAASFAVAAGRQFDCASTFGRKSGDSFAYMDGETRNRRQVRDATSAGDSSVSIDLTKLSIRSYSGGSSSFSVILSL